ncbi:hypothetical protein VNO77_00980 [Canavalia gladiata]|uniref:Uncharacterized protein n=1 Tax=Canavalia gladiata TaxID=3824 RepID=A0AAN9MS88_CANGL
MGQYRRVFIYFFRIVIHGGYGSVSHPALLISVIDDLVEISSSAYSNPRLCFFRVKIEAGFEYGLCQHSLNYEDVHSLMISPCDLCLDPCDLAS